MPEATKEARTLRYLVATLGYRLGVALEGVPASFAGYRPPHDVRTPASLLGHLADLLERCLTMLGAAGDDATAAGKRPEAASGTPSSAWIQAHARIARALPLLDQALARSGADRATADALVRGPLSDALTHVGQLLLLRRLAGCPAVRTSYPNASVRIGELRLPAAGPGKAGAE